MAKDSRFGSKSANRDLLRQEFNRCAEEACGKEKEMVEHHLSKAFLCRRTAESGNRLVFGRTLACKQL